MNTFSQFDNVEKKPSILLIKKSFFKSDFFFFVTFPLESRTLKETKEKIKELVTAFHASIRLNPNSK